MNNFFITKDRHEYIKNFHNDVISWDELIQCFDHNIQNERFIKIFPNFGLVLHEIETIEKIFPIINEIIINNPQKNILHMHM